MGLERDDVGQEVGALEDEVLDDEVDLLVGVLDAGDGDVADLLDERGKDLLADVVPELGLELERAVVVKEDVLGEPLPVLAKADVDGVGAHRLEELGDRVEEVVLVGGVLVVEELLARLAELAALAGRLVLEDISRLDEALADVLRQLVEPVAELRVVVGVGVERVDSVKDGVHRAAVGEALEERLELGVGLLEGRVLGDGADRVAALVGEVLRMALVGVGLVEEEVDGVVVVVVLGKGERGRRVNILARAGETDSRRLKTHLLALDDDLLEPVDELLAALLRELLVEELLGAVALLAGLVALVVVGRHLVLEGGELRLEVLLVALGRVAVDIVGPLGAALLDAVDTALAVGLLALLGSLLEAGSALRLGVLLSRVVLVLLLLSDVSGLAGVGLVAVGVDVLGALGGRSLRVVLDRVAADLGLEDGGLVLANPLAVLRDPLVRGRLLVDLLELVLVGASLLGRLSGDRGKEVAANETHL